MLFLVLQANYREKSACWEFYP